MNILEKLDEIKNYDDGMDLIGSYKPILLYLYVDDIEAELYDAEEEKFLVELSQRLYGCIVVVKMEAPIETDKLWGLMEKYTNNGLRSLSLIYSGKTIRTFESYHNNLINDLSNTLLKYDWGKISQLDTSEQNSKINEIMMELKADKSPFTKGASINFKRVFQSIGTLLLISYVAIFIFGKNEEKQGGNNVQTADTEVETFSDKEDEKVNVEELISDARGNVKKENYSEALKLYEEALKKQGKLSMDDYHNMGRAYGLLLEKPDLEMGKHYLETALKMSHVIQNPLAQEEKFIVLTQALDKVDNMEIPNETFNEINKAGVMREFEIFLTLYALGYSDKLPTPYLDSLNRFIKDKEKNGEEYPIPKKISTMREDSHTSYLDRSENGEEKSAGKLKITPGIFKEKYNAISEETIAEDNFLIKDITIQNVEKNNVFQVKFNENIIISGMLNSKNEIISLMAFTEEDGGPETGPYNLMIREALIKIFSPEITEREIIYLQDTLGFIGSYSEIQNQIGQSFSKTIGNVKYTSDFRIVENGNVLEILGLDVSE